MRWPRHAISTRFSVLCLAAVVTLALVMGLTLSSLLTRAVSEWEWPAAAALVGSISLAAGAMLYAVLLLTQVYRRQVEEAMLRSHAERLEAEVEERTQQFMQVQKMQAIGLLAGGIAHDFNNLLTVISGRAQILLHHVRTDPIVQQNAEAIQDSAERAVSLTRQLLTFSRKQILERRPVDLNAVIVDMAKMLQRLIGEHIQVSTTLAPSTACVNADRAQLEQMILNLAINARDAMLQGGRLTLTVDTVDTVESDGGPAAVGTLPAGRFVRLVVSDTGTGMDEATRRRIFEPFFTTKGVGQGTGLGLYTVYGVVEQHEGHIAVESERGKGTTFTVCIPQGDDPVPAPTAAPGVTRAGSETIMVVEDDDAVRELATHFLLEHGYTVLSAGDGEDALDVAARHRGPIHLLLTDVVMPRVSGWQLAPRFVGLHPESRVLYMTGYTEVPALPGVRVLQKPFTAFSLLQAVRELVDAQPQPSSPLASLLETAAR